VVTFDSSGAGETIISEETGIILEEKNVEAMIKILKSLPRRTGFPTNVNGKLAKISKENFVKPYVDLYESLVYGKTSRSEQSQEDSATSIVLICGDERV
jgi:hypothetical protein